MRDNLVEEVNILKKSINSANTNCNSRHRSRNHLELSEEETSRCRGCAEPQIMDFFQHIHLFLRLAYHCR